MNYKKLVLIIIVLFAFVIGLCCIYIQEKNNSKNYSSNKNNTQGEYLYQEELNRLHEEEQKQLMKEINDEKTDNYIIKESSDTTISLQYAYVTENYIKIKLSYTLDKQPSNTYNSFSNEEKEDYLIRKFSEALEGTKMDNEDTWIITENKKTVIPERTSDGDGGRTLTSPTGIYEWHDTFPLTTEDATENLTLYFTKANNEIVILKLQKKK